MTDAGAGESVEALCGSVDGASRIVGGYGDDGAGAVAYRVTDGVEVELVVGIGSDEHGAAIGHGDGHFVVEVEGRHDNDLVAGVGNGQQRVVEAHIRSGGDHQDLVGGDSDIVFGGEFVAQCIL